MEPQVKLFKTDKNGTKYYEVTCSCGKCNGTGFILEYKHVEAGVCFDCGGSGIITYTDKVYSDEYLAKLERQREKREEKRRASWSVEAALKKMGLGLEVGIVVDAKSGTLADSADRTTWYFLKYQAGCQAFGWGCDLVTTIDNKCVTADGRFQIIPVPWDELFVADYDTCTIREVMNISKVIRESLAKRTYVYPPKPIYTSEYVGNAGDKIITVVRLIKKTSFKSSFGYNQYTNVYTFEDEKHNYLVWKTSSTIDVKEDDRVMLTGTIKEHGEYNGVKQTYVIRCKFMGA